MPKLHVAFLGVALATPGFLLAEQPRPAQTKMAVKTVSIPVKGMACGVCAARVTKTLSVIEGVKSVEVSAPKGNARVTYVEAKVSLEDLRTAVNKLGFEAGTPVAQE